MRRIKQLGEPVGGFLCGGIALLLAAWLVGMWTVNIDGMLR